MFLRRLMIHCLRIPASTLTHFTSLVRVIFRSFFSKGSATSLSLSIEGYFASKFDTDPDFRDAYSVDGIAWGTNYAGTPHAQTQIKLRQQWEALRRDYLRFYALRASGTPSLGSHDEC